MGKNKAQTKNNVCFGQIGSSENLENEREDKSRNGLKFSASKSSGLSGGLEFEPKQYELKKGLTLSFGKYRNLSF